MINNHSPSSQLYLDHLAVTAPTLEAGIGYVHTHLGIKLPYGGEHIKMGTHNCLMRIGKNEYLEIIAIDPKAVHPNKPRWFNLDNSDQQEAALATWIVRTENIEQAVKRNEYSLGTITPMSRGNLNWQITIHEDGHLPLAGAFPSLIEWGCENHPAENMKDFGISLTMLKIKHPEINLIKKFLEARFFDQRIVFEHAENYEIMAEFKTENGESKNLSGRFII